MFKLKFERTGSITLASAMAAAALLSVLAFRDSDVERHPAVVRLIVGFSPGGGHDLYARVLSRHLGKYLPGTPTVIVENMSGGGGLIAASYLALRAKPDGATFGEVGPGLSAAVEGILDIGFDPRAFQFVGGLTPAAEVCIFSKASGITALAKWAAAPRSPRVGMTGPGSSSVMSALTLASALQLPIQPIMGYPGAAQIRLAVESGEVDGACINWDSAKATWIPRDRFAVVLQAGARHIAELPHVPLAIEHAKSETARAILDGPFRLLTSLARSYALPPGTSPQRLLTFRAAFTATMSDPLFVADAQKAGLDIRPATGENVAQQVSALFQISPPLLASFRSTLQGHHRSVARPAS